MVFIYITHRPSRSRIVAYRLFAKGQACLLHRPVTLYSCLQNVFVLVLTLKEQKFCESRFHTASSCCILLQELRKTNARQIPPAQKNFSTKTAELNLLQDPSQQTPLPLLPTTKKKKKSVRYQSKQNHLSSHGTSLQRIPSISCFQKQPSKNYHGFDSVHTSLSLTASIPNSSNNSALLLPQCPTPAEFQYGQNGHQPTTHRPTNNPIIIILNNCTKIGIQSLFGTNI